MCSKLLPTLFFSPAVFSRSSMVGDADDTSAVLMAFITRALPPAMPSPRWWPRWVTKVGDAEFPAAVELCRERLDRLIPDLCLWRGEVRKVRHVIDREEPGGCDLLFVELAVRIGQGLGIPSPGVAGELLEDIAPGVFCPVHARSSDPAIETWTPNLYLSHGRPSLET